MRTARYYTVRTAVRLLLCAAIALAAVGFGIWFPFAVVH